MGTKLDICKSATEATTRCANLKKNCVYPPTIRHGTAMAFLYTGVE